jgi:hypothetical protein
MKLANQETISTGNAGAFTKIIVIVCLILLSLGLIFAWNSPATGYEASIFTATPIFFWVAILINLVCGIGIVVWQIYGGKHLKNRFWTLGWVLIIGVYLSIVSLWVIRGYLQWGLSDQLTHKALTDYILNNGKFQASNFYPVSHILLSESVLIFKIPDTILMKYIPFIFDILYLLFMYVLAKSLISSKGVLLLVLVGATTLTFLSNPGFAPNSLANAYLPFAVFLLVKSTPPGTFSWKIPFLIVLFLMPIFHPVPTFELFIIMISVTMPLLIMAAMKKRSLTSLKSVFSFRLAASLFLLVWSVYWFSSYSGILNEAVSNIRALFSGLGISHFAQLTQQIQYAAEFGYSALQQFFVNYGVAALYILIALASVFALLKKSEELERNNLFSLYGPVIASSIIMLLLFGLNLAFSPLRIVNYVDLLCVIIMGFGLYKFLRISLFKPRNRKINGLVTLPVIIIFIVGFIGGVLQVYPSRYTLSPNDQVTRTLVDGADWFFHSKNPEIPNSGILVQLPRLADYTLTPAEISAQPYLGIQLLNGPNSMPWHFNYDAYSMLGEWFPQASYLLITQEDKVVYPDVYPRMEQTRFTPADFAKLEQDPTVAELYTNGGLDIYYVTPVALEQNK